MIGKPKKEREGERLSRSKALKGGRERMSKT